MTRESDDPETLRALFSPAYHIEAKLGQGAYGSVYAALQLPGNKRVAIKILTALADKTVRTRFRNEARIVSQIGHPNVVTIYNYGELKDGRRFLVMEYLEGQSLEAFIEANGPTSVEVAAALISQLCHGLAAAHELKIVHRDLKPANLMLVSLRRGPPLLKVLDFGIAKMPSQKLTGSLDLLGTPHYMSPEQWQTAGKSDARSDIYAVGVILFELLFGTPPFNGRSWSELYAAHLSQSPPIPEEWERSSPANAAFGMLLRRCLEKLPTLRFQSASDLRQAIEHAITC